MPRKKIATNNKERRVRELTTENKKPESRRRGLRGASLLTGTWSARLLETPPPEIVALDPMVPGGLADPAIPRELREGILALSLPDFGFWLQRRLQPLVTNFFTNLAIKRNDRSELIAAGIIFSGQSKADERTVLQNRSQLNAFRHAFGQAIITKEYDRRHAELVGSTHEDLPAIDTTRRYFSNLTTPSNALFEADTVADQLNNEIGRRIGERLGKKASNREIAEAVLVEFKDNGLYVASFRGPGEVILSRQRLSEAEFLIHTLLLKSLNEEGKLTP